MKILNETCCCQQTFLHSSALDNQLAKSARLEGMDQMMYINLKLFNMGL